MRKGDLYNKMNLNWLNDYNQYILYMVEIINNQSYLISKRIISILFYFNNIKEIN